ncbi:hypothetical protein KKH24_02090, partial [Patescibacteria group bacterium]|nr:hypothetical protein [Patescibacteria group bacterium]
MMIYANGQDIHKIIFANLQKEIAVENIRIIDCGPEGFLKAFVSFLEHESIDLYKIKKIFVVIGPGSATALRGSLSIFNTLGFTRAI